MRLLLQARRSRSPRPTFTFPRSTRPVATVPRPEIVKMSSIGIRNGLSISRCRQRDVAVHRRHQLQDRLRRVVLAVPFQGLGRRAADDRDLVARGTCTIFSSSRTSSSTRSRSSGSSTMSTLFRKTTIDGTPTCRASRMCSRVWGIGPSAARDHQDRPVHLGRSRDHVLDVVGVARAVHVRVVAVRRLVLHVRRVDRDPALPLLGRVVDLVVRLERAPSGSPPRAPS